MVKDPVAARRCNTAYLSLCSRIVGVRRSSSTSTTTVTTPPIHPSIHPSTYPPTIHPLLSTPYPLVVASRQTCLVFGTQQQQQQQQPLRGKRSYSMAMAAALLTGELCCWTGTQEDGHDARAEFAMLELRILAYECRKIILKLS
ncbi:hypothetical protein M0802_011406 [Mischocyttarus mexicanus]|nr:hypothetical protein M0802_011406 [Mischocyttarus mexicanus]